MLSIRALVSRDSSVVRGLTSSLVIYNSEADATLRLTAGSLVCASHSCFSTSLTPHATSGSEAGYLHCETQWAIPDVHAFSSIVSCLSDESAGGRSVVKDTEERAAVQAKQECETALRCSGIPQGGWCAENLHIKGRRRGCSTRPVGQTS